MSKTKILVIEDEKIVGKHLQKAMNHLGYSVPAVVSSGEEALARVEETQPDLILIDILLKGKLDGIETAKVIRDRFRIPVVYLTAFADEATLQRAKLTEPYGYLIKPFQDRELHSTIKIALHRRNIEAELETRNKWLFGALSNVSDAVIATDKRGQVIFLNPCAERLTGFNQETAVGKNLIQVFDIRYDIGRNETPIEVEHSSSPVTPGGLIFNLQSDPVLRDKRGKKIPIRATFFPMRGETGNICGGVVIFQQKTRNSEGRINPQSRVSHELFSDFPSPLYFNVGKEGITDSKGMKTASKPTSSIPLTRREIEILSLLSRGLVSKEIAESLNLSNATVRTHIQRILQKMKVHTKLEAVLLAIQKNFIEISTN